MWAGILILWIIAAFAGWVFVIGADIATNGDD